MGWVRRRPTWRWVVDIAGLVVLGAIFLTFDSTPHLSDGYAYWSAWDGGLYDKAWLEHHAYVYSPAFAQLLWPLTHLSWPVFNALWMAGQMAVAIALVTPIGLAVLLVAPAMQFVQFTIERGNIHFFLAGAVTFAVLRWPVLWALVLHTKPTMGAALAWYVGRRDWKGLKVSLISTFAIGVLSFAIAPQLWVDWWALMADGASRSPTGLLLPRLVLAAFIAWIGGVANQRWPVPIAAFLAAPTIWVGSSEVMFFGALFLAWQDWRDGRLFRLSRSHTAGVASAPC